MRKPGLIKVKSIETEEIIMAMAKLIITTVIKEIILIIRIIIMRIRIGNQQQSIRTKIKKKHK